MGCDIHMYPEVKRWGYWNFVYRFEPNEYSRDRFPDRDRHNYFSYDDRNYTLFARLAGVRGTDTDLVAPMAEPRGVPEDADYDIRSEMDNGDYHSKSWFSLDELLAQNWDRPDGYVYHPYERFKILLERLKDLDPDPKNVRIIFAFDN